MPMCLGLQCTDLLRVQTALAPPMSLRRRCVLLLFGLMAILLTGLAGAQPIARVELVDATRIRWTGRIDLTALQQLRVLLDAHPSVSMLELFDSPGAFEWGRRVVLDAADLIQRRRLATTARGYCISACAAIFLAGVQRELADESVRPIGQEPVEPPPVSFLHWHGLYASGPQGPALDPDATRWLLHRLGGLMGQAWPEPLARAVMEAQTPRGGVYLIRRLAAGRVDEGVYTCVGTERRIPLDCTRYTARSARELGLLRD